MNKKIVILINSLDGGGAERVVSTLLNNLIEKYECHLILMENKISYDLDRRINIISLDESSNQNGIIKLLRLPIIAYKLHKIIKKYTPKQIDEAIGGFFTQNTYKATRLRPTHFLELNHFEKYLTCWQTNEVLFPKNIKPVERL